MADTIIAPVRGVFRALAATCVPEVSALDDRGWAAAEAIVEQALAERADRTAERLLVDAPALFGAGAD